MTPYIFLEFCELNGHSDILKMVEDRDITYLEAIDILMTKLYTHFWEIQE